MSVTQRPQPVPGVGPDALARRWSTPGATIGQPWSTPHAGPPAPDRAPATSGGWRVAFGGRPIWPTVLLAGLFAVGLATGLRMVWGFVIVAAVAVALETAFRRHRQAVLRPGLRTDITHFLFTHYLQTACLFVSAGLCVVVLRPLTIPATRDWLAVQPVWVTAGLGFLGFTFLLYWQHRLAHTVPFLWRFHAVHHSSAQLDWVAAARLHPMEFFFGGFLLAPPLVILGFQPASIAAFSAVTTAWAVLEHANVRWRLRWMDRLYPNPEYHHWHHSLHAEAIDKNFGLPLWDTLFGSYHMPKGARPDTYGIREPMPSSYLGQMIQPFRPRHPAPADLNGSAGRRGDP